MLDFFQYFQFKSYTYDYEGKKHSLNITEVTTSRNGAKTLIKILNGLILHSGQIFKQNPVFFTIQTVLIKERHNFIVRSYLAIIFFSLIKAEVRILVKLVKLRQCQSVNKLFP